MTTGTEQTSIRSHIDRYNDQLALARNHLRNAFVAMRSAVLEAKDKGGKANDYAQVYAAIYRGDASLNEVIKPLSDILTELKTQKVPEAFEADQIKTLTMADGSRITISNVVRASVVGGKKDQAFAYLRQHELGDLITETLNSSTLSSFAKSLLEQNKELPDDLFHVAVMSQVSYTGSKAK